MAYRVTIENTGIQFDFINVDDATQFASMAAEFGTVEDYHYVKDEKGEHIRVSDGWRPIITHFEKVDEPETITIYADGESILEVAGNE